MITSDQLKSFLHVQPSDFECPDRLDYSIVNAYDHFINQVGSKPIYLSGYRPGDPRQHGLGLAIDPTWPGRDPVEIWNLARQSHLFNGLGV